MGAKEGRVKAFVADERGSYPHCSRDRFDSSSEDIVSTVRIAVVAAAADWKNLNEWVSAVDIVGIDCRSTFVWVTMIHLKRVRRVPFRQHTCR